ncbi:MAG: alpha/beta hydrolase [Polyangiales bacterium]
MRAWWLYSAVAIQLCQLGCAGDAQQAPPQTTAGSGATGMSTLGAAGSRAAGAGSAAAGSAAAGSTARPGMVGTVGTMGTPGSPAGPNTPVTPPAAAGGQAPSVTPPAATPPVTTPPTTVPPPPASAGAAAPAPTTPTGPATPAGPNDGDPAKPIVAVADLPCKQDGGFPGGGANYKIDDRDVIISYPCNKHEGAPVTFILNLHGTTPVNLHFYQEGYFSAARYVGSHNLIVATPSSVVEQWGNGDNGADLPYLMHVIDWVYTQLGTKFDIRSMWVGGHSWGAFYTSTFACKPELADKVKGIIIMSGSPRQPACAGVMSVINTNAEMDIGPPLDQGPIPMQHGCGAAAMAMLGNNTQTLWPDCMPGFVHANYLMLGKGHIDSIDDVVVKDIVDLINKARP